MNFLPLAAGGLVAVAVAVSGRRAVVSTPQVAQYFFEGLGMDKVTEAVGLSRPRGIRNNNPLNIELGEPWQGLAPEQTDGRFAQFVDPRYGYRAAAKILDSYARRGIRTLAQIIGTWAPAHENNVRAYVDSVAKRAGIAPVQLVERHHYPQLFEAMTQHENGQQPYALALIAEGVSWA